MLANDPDVSEWVYGILHGEPVPSGEFLRCFAETMTRADPGCYASLVPAARIFMKRFPKYKCGCQVWEQPPSIPNFASVGTPVSTQAGRDAQAKKDAESADMQKRHHAVDCPGKDGQRAADPSGIGPYVTCALCDWRIPVFQPGSNLPTSEMTAHSGVVTGFSQLPLVNMHQDIMRLREALEAIGGYRHHLSFCEFEMTEFCTCGMKQAADKCRAALEAI